MTPEAQQIAIAEACGIVGPFDNRWIKEYEKEGGDAHGFTGFEKGELVFIPDYLNDLNAMHEAEEELGSYIPNFLKYLNILKEVNPMCVRATAAQRAEAFLRTIEKWEDK